MCWPLYSCCSLHSTTTLFNLHVFFPAASTALPIQTLTLVLGIPHAGEQLAECEQNHQHLWWQSYFCHTALATALSQFSMWQWKGLCHLFGFTHKCHLGNHFSHTPNCILERHWIANKYPKSTQNRSWLFFPSVTTKEGKLQHFNRQEKNLINISLL